MELLERDGWPRWLRDADTKDAVVGGTADWPVWRGGEWRGGVWRGGEWLDGVWRDGVWRDGVWRGGEWRGGVWRGGEWRGGVWWGGEWRGGEWRDGVWRDGVWRGGVWRGGEWRDGVWRGGEWWGGEWRGGEWRDQRIPDRIAYMASLAGIAWLDGRYVGWRSTTAEGKGRPFPTFVQQEGPQTYPHDLAGKGVCFPGIHVASAATAFTYFGIDQTAQLWRVEFTREQLLDCDGQKARISGGTFTKQPWPWRKRN